MNAMTPAFGSAPMLNSDLAKAAMDRWTELKQDRVQAERDWEDIARLIRPQRGGFTATDPHQRQLEKPLSSEAIIAQMNMSASLYGTLTSPANRWFGLRVADPELNDRQEVREWSDLVVTRILRSFQPTMAPFYDASIQLFSDITSFGNAVQYDEILPGKRRIMDITLSLAEAVWDVDAWGQVTEVVRKFMLKPRAAVAMFGAPALPPKIVELAEKGDQAKIAFFQHVQANDGFVKGMLGHKGKRWLSIYACETDSALIRQSGYDDMPFHVPRWDVESGFSWGTGPGFVALASARAHHRMDEATLRAAQKAADPTILAPDRNVWPISGQMRPGAVIYGAVNAAGQRLIQTMDGNGNIGLTYEEKRGKLENVREAFHWTLMNLTGRTGVTPEETYMIEEQKQRLMAPYLGRVQHEYLRPKIERRFAMLLKAGQIPPPPKAAGGQPLEVEYTSAAALAQRSTEAAATNRIIADLTPLAQLDPRYVDRLSPDDLVDVLHQARGAPARILRSREEADQIAKARAQAQAQAQQMAMAQQAGATAKDFAQAAAVAGGQGGEA